MRARAGRRRKMVLLRKEEIEAMQPRDPITFNYPESQDVAKAQLKKVVEHWNAHKPTMMSKYIANTEEPQWFYSQENIEAFWQALKKEIE